MKRVLRLLVIGFFLVGAATLSVGKLSLAAIAQVPDQTTMPEVVTLGKDAKLGQVAFNHVKHNGGTYSIVPGQKIGMCFLSSHRSAGGRASKAPAAQDLMAGRQDNDPDAGPVHQGPEGLGRRRVPRLPRP